jgi:hypothetical protein
MKHDDIFNKESKRSMKKYVWISLLIIVAIGLFLIFSNNNSDDETELNVNTQDSETTINQTGIVATQAYNQVVIDKEITFDEFPYILSEELDSKMKYEITFETDNQIQFVVYSEERYNQWLDTKIHTTSKATTKSGSICCDTKRTFNVDINEGEGGLYYFVFDNSNLPDDADLPTTGKLTVTKKTNI